MSLDLSGTFSVTLRVRNSIKSHSLQRGEDHFDSLSLVLVPAPAVNGTDLEPIANITLRGFSSS